MNKGDIIQLEGKRFKIQKVISDSVYASLMITDDKCQRGKPRRFRFDELAKSMGTTVEAIKTKLIAKTVLKQELKIVAEESVSEEESESAPMASSVSQTQKSPLHEVLSQYEEEEITTSD